jgi:molybdate transport system permease protein
MTPTPQTRSAGGSAVPFYVALGLLGGLYVGLIAALLVADLAYTSPGHIARALAAPEIRSAVWLSLLSCSFTAILSVWVAVPLGYLLARTRFPGRGFVDLLLDVPIVLPPLVVGLSLLILFQTPPGRAIQRVVPVTYAVPAVVLAQFAVAAAFAVRTMRVTFEQLPPRTEDVAMTLGCSRGRAFWLVTLPEAWRGVLTAGTLAWARALGEFGPILVFAGATRMRTEVLSTTVFLELSTGDLEAALGVSVLMIAVAVVVLLVTRTFGLRGTGLI